MALSLLVRLALPRFYPKPEPVLIRQQTPHFWLWESVIRTSVVLGTDQRCIDVRMYLSDAARLVATQVRIALVDPRPFQRLASTGGCPTPRSRYA